MTDHEITAYLKSQFWAILPKSFEMLISNRANSKKRNGEEWVLTESLPDGYGYVVDNGVAFINIDAPTQKRFDFWSWVFGLKATELIRKDFEKALGDDTVKSIFLNIDSPGGTVDGTKELSDFIYNARGQKPIIAYTNGGMFSAAYYIGSAADKIFAAPSAGVGSIGVYMAHVDASRAYQDAGYKVSIIKAGKHKAIGNPYEELSPEARAELQSEIDALYDMFVSDVARNRGVEKAVAKTKMADGQCFLADAGLEAGLIDGIAYKEQVIIEHLLSGINSNQNEGGPQMTAAELKAKEPKLYEEIFGLGMAEGKNVSAAAAREEGKKEGVNEGLKTGAENERARIQAIETLSAPGAEKIVAENKFKPEMTKEKIAVIILDAAAKGKTNALENLAADGKSLAENAENINASLPNSEKKPGDKGDATPSEEKAVVDRIAKGGSKNKPEAAK